MNRRDEVQPNERKIITIPEKVVTNFEKVVTN